MKDMSLYLELIHNTDRKHDWIDAPCNSPVDNKDALCQWYPEWVGEVVDGRWVQERSWRRERRTFCA